MRRRYFCRVLRVSGTHQGRRLRDARESSISKRPIRRTSFVANTREESTSPHARAGATRFRSGRRVHARCRYHDEISVRPGDLRVHARGFKPGDLLVEFARVIDLRVDRSRYVRGIDRLHDIGEDKAAACGELPAIRRKRSALLVPAR
jgi:hypothetical protein